MYFLEKFENNIKENPDRIAVCYSASNESITNQQLEEYSGRVYNYLKSKGIGKEDFVLIYLPRGVLPFIAMFGIWKAGAALTVIENIYPQERMEYIRKDINAKLVLNEEVYKEMMSFDYIPGYEVADEHDACFAIYTSGSTGNPKGVLHEYGKLDVLLLDAPKIKGDTVRAYANIAPLNFVAFVGTCFNLYMYGYTIHIIPFDIVKNPPRMIQYLEENQISVFFGTPSYLKILPPIPKCVKHIAASGEPCSDLYIPDLELINLYSCSETAIKMALFYLDHKYTKTPVGKSPYEGFGCFLIDDEGKEVKKGEKGEICIQNDFTRGYINLSEKTKETFIDGIYHSGDIGYLDENDNLILCGRKDDMVKINGNRIEPAEIEYALRKILGIKMTIAKGFVKANKSYVVGYFIKQELMALNLLNDSGEFNMDIQKLNEQLSEYIPYYMIPSVYMVLDEFPKNASGKIFRKAFPDPKNEQGEYIAPQTEEEKYICGLFEEVLKTKNVSVEEGFYRLGGDSLDAMNLVVALNNSEISVTDIYRERTPRKLAKLYVQKKSISKKDIEEENSKALFSLQELYGDSLNVIMNQSDSPNSTAANLTILNKLSGDVDVNRLKEATDKVLKAHSAYSTHIVSDNGTLKMKYNPAFFNETEIIAVSDKEFSELKTSLVQPFTILNECLYRNRIYKTENGNYLFMDVHHSMADGTSLGIVLKQIAECYKNDAYAIPKDYFYLIAENSVKKKTATETIESEKKHKELIRNISELNKESEFVYLKKDSESNRYEYADKMDTFAFKKSEQKDSRIRKYGGNVFFLTAFLKAIASYNHQDKAYSEFIHNGRDEMIKMNAHGLLFHAYPIFVDFTKLKTVDEMLDAVQEKVNAEIAEGYENYTRDCTGILEDAPYFIYQHNIYRIQDTDIFEENIDLSEQKNALDTYVNLQIIDNDDSDDYIIHLEYARDCYKEESTNQFLKIYKDCVKELL